MSAYLNISRDKYFISQNAQFQGDQTEDMMKKKKKSNIIYSVLQMVAITFGPTDIKCNVFGTIWTQHTQLRSY